MLDSIEVCVIYSAYGKLAALPSSGRSWFTNSD